MGISVAWCSKGNDFIETRFSDPWSLDDFLRARQTWHKMIRSVDYRVPIVLDLRDSSSAPRGILQHFLAIHRTPHPRQGHVHILGLNGDMERLKDHLVHGVTDPAKSVIFIESAADIVF